MLYAAFILGFAGSLHCLGMCGPIAFALPVRSTDVWVKIWKYLLYNLGRITTYALFGMAIGFAGKGLALAGLQHLVSLAAGVLMIASVLVVHLSLPFLGMGTLAYRIKQYIRSWFQRFYTKPDAASLFMIGVVNGLLPCGMVYMAMLAALATGELFSAIFFMTVFGAGTVPLMLSVSLSSTIVSMRMKQTFMKAMPVILCLVGSLLILRGLQIPLPYMDHSSAHSCCTIQANRYP